MKNKPNLIEAQLRNDTPPLMTHGIPNANELLTRFRRSRTNRRTIMSIAMATVVVVAAGYLTRVGKLSFRDGNISVAGDSRLQIPAVETLTVSDSPNKMPTNTEHKSLHTRDAVAPDSWLLELGEINEQGLIPLILSRHGQHGTGEATTVGFVEPPQIKDVPLWQLPPQTQDAIYANWTEAGYQPSFGL